MLSAIGEMGRQRRHATEPKRKYLVGTALFNATPMRPVPSEPRPPKPSFRQQTEAVFPRPIARSDAGLGRFAQPGGDKPHIVGLRATVLLAGAVYAAALGASALLDVRATVLDGVPLCLGPAAFVWFCSRIVFPRAVRLARAIEAAFIIVVLGLSLACLSYLGVLAGLPLRDGEMIWIDRHLGFDWLQIMTGLDGMPAVLNVLDWAYATFTSQLIATVLVLIIANRTRDLDRFFVTFVCAAVIAELASVALPTLGPMWALAEETNFAYLPTIGRATADIVLALREGGLKTIDLHAIDGIISFPSVHAAVAVIVPFTLRWSKALFWPVLVLDGVMLISAVPSGNHYLADVLGGVAIAVLAIVCGRQLTASLERLVAPTAGIANSRILDSRSAVSG